MFVGISELERLVILAGIWALRAITPISFLHLVLSTSHSYSLRGYYLITSYTLIEVLFYLFFFLPRKAFLQKPAVHPPPLSPEDREQLFSRCLAHLKDAQSFNQWFLDSPSQVPRQNVLEWLKWGFFAGEPCVNDRCSKHDEELEEYLGQLEHALGEKFPPGYDPKLKSIRITLDDVVVYHRPVVWYLVVCIVDTISSTILKYHGFIHFSAPVPVFPPRLHTLFSPRSPSPVLSYWYKPGTSRQPTPLLFLHGIGIGLFPYVPLLIAYSKVHPDAGILVPEFLNISGRITRPPLSPRQFQSALGTIFHYHQITSYNLAGHSYGTGLSSILIRSTAQSLQPLIPKPSSVTLLDPIPILLHLPSVARNFLYRKPQNANEHEIYFFACTDLGVAHSLARHFFWTECVLWKEDLDSLRPDELENEGPDVSKPRVAIVLSGEDIIVDSPAIWTYLTNTSPPMLKTAEPRPFVPPAPHPDAFIPTICEGGNIEAYYLGGLDHAQMFLRGESWKGLIRVIDRVSRS
ncbi:unnamed protein product [Rhizoctonia solani]|uniref:AB hydrolase-1 domain-containing protein n=1 Tax=Rhizoctonia solani TaxID=456999 RepID=A0A8H2XJ27_9AGAM|nr:unnamed protein product [Rhizoctonia solani]